MAPRPMSELRSVKAVVEEWDNVAQALAGLRGHMWEGVKEHLDQRQRRIAEMLRDLEIARDKAK